MQTHRFGKKSAASRSISKIGKRARQLIFTAYCSLLAR
jgi:hypothetical protein